MARIARVGNLVEIRADVFISLDAFALGFAVNGRTLVLPPPAAAQGGVFQFAFNEIELARVLRALTESTQPPRLMVIDKANSTAHDAGELNIDGSLVSKFMDTISVTRNFPFSKPGRIGVFTHVYNEDVMLKLWCDHYSAIFGVENVYIVDHGSTNGYIQANIDPRINVVSMPRKELDHWNLANMTGYFQRFLLQSYEWVLHTDADEFLTLKNAPDRLVDYITSLPKTGTYRFTGFDLIHDFTKEPEIDWTQPLTRQRSLLKRNHAMDKVNLSCSPSSWLPGWHECFEPVTGDENLWNIHLHYVDYKSTCEKKLRWRNFAVSQLDRSAGHYGGYQLWEDGEIRKNMTQWIGEAAEGHPDYQKVPDWMVGAL